MEGEGQVEDSNPWFIARKVDGDVHLCRHVAAPTASLRAPSLPAGVAAGDILPVLSSR